MDVASTSNQSSSVTNNVATKFTADLNTFLKLLTTQLKHQDPTEPLDPNEFTAQLVQFSSVEQQIGMNSKLGELIALQKSNEMLAAANYLGTTVEATGSTLPVVNGKGEFTYTLDKASDTTTIVIRDRAGKAVYSGAGSTTVGKHSFVWDGKSNSGAQLPDGAYTFSINAVADKAPVETTTGVVGQVTGMGRLNDKMSLSLSGVPVSLDQLIEVRKTPAPTTGTGQ
jgi:flagellar basal-body rod modification protein FlgD